MELDKLKNTWGKVSEIDTKPSDEQIIRLIKTSNQSIIRRIVSAEKIAFRAILVIPFISLIVSILAYLLTPETGIKAFYIFFMIVILSTASSIWMSIKLKYLNKIDIINSDILLISKFVNKYRKFSIYESVISLIWFILFLFVLLSVVYSDDGLFEYLLFGGCALVLVLLAFFYIRNSYKDTIGVIKRNLEEMRAFEKEELIVD